MIDSQTISMGRVRQAYALTDNKVESVIQALWPDMVFPVELWRRAHETYWRAFVDANQAIYKIESLVLPKIDLSAKCFHTHLCALDVMTFFQKLSLNISASTLRQGLQYILEETYEDIDGVFPEERGFLFNTLSRLEKVDVFDQYSPDSELFEAKLPSLSISSYHFISHIFSDTVLVDTVAIIHHLQHYPLVQEVKGITHALKDSILNTSATKANTEPETTVLPKEQAIASPSETPQNVIAVPRSLWEGKTRESIVASMRSAGIDDEAVIAHVIFFKIKIKGKRAVGALLGTPNRSDYLYDKKGRELYDKAKLITVVNKDES